MSKSSGSAADTDKLHSVTSATSATALNLTQLEHIRRPSSGNIALSFAALTSNDKKQPIIP
jgi:hypothetical protein